MHTRPPAAVVLACVALVAGGCSGPSGGHDSAGSGGGSQTLTVYAAASLKSSFDEIAHDFEQEHPEVDVAPISYDGSSTLATQIEQGAPVDVFASADQANMTTVTDAGLANDPQVFASNTLVVAVPKGNPAGIEDLADLSDATVALCAPKVPCGAASKTLLGNQHVQVTPVTQEQNVTAVEQKVAAGEVDAGLVYATDVRGDDAVDSFAPDGAEDVVNSYPIVALDDAPSSQAAAAFVAYVTGDAGQRVLADHGFGTP
jgi:molybdate transport system substrate-binding protein